MQYTTTCHSFYELSHDDLYAIMALRQEVFVVEQNCPYLDADGRDQAALHVCFWNESHELLAYTRLLPKGIAYDTYAAIGRVITSERARGMGLGRPLMRASIQALHEAYGVQPIKISAQAHLQHFYESVGFEWTGAKYLEDGIPHIAMIRK